jgi:hypothetical protein
MHGMIELGLTPSVSKSIIPCISLLRLQNQIVFEKYYVEVYFVHPSSNTPIKLPNLLSIIVSSIA